jgi:hypothetical protein
MTLYEPIAIFARPLWQQAKTNLNIMSKPIFLLVKTCLQIVLIAVGKSLQAIDKLAHGIFFSTLILGFMIYVIKVKPFNYKRCNLWEALTLFAVFWISFLAMISRYADPTNIAWFISLISVWLVLIIFGILWQKKFYANLLVP